MALLSLSGPKCPELQGPGSHFSRLGPKALLLPQWSGRGTGILVHDGMFLETQGIWRSCLEHVPNSLGLNLRNRREFSSIVIHTGEELKTETHCQLKCQVNVMSQNIGNTVSIKKCMWNQKAKN